MIDIFNKKRGIYGTVSSIFSLALEAHRRMLEGDMKAVGDYAEVGYELWRGEMITKK